MLGREKRTEDVAFREFLFKSFDSLDVFVNDSPDSELAC